MYIDETKTTMCAHCRYPIYSLNPLTIIITHEKKFILYIASETETETNPRIF